MNSLLSAISGKFSQSLILGTFFPVVIFLIAGALMLQPILPQGLPLVQAFQSLDTGWELLALTIAATLLSGLLYNFNTPILRFYEGYPWRRSWLGDNWRTPRYRKRMAEAAKLIPRLRLLRNAWEPIGGRSAEYSNLQAGLDQLGQILTMEYPHELSFVLPTRFGNVIRASEAYPQREYEMDAILFWPRLVKVASKDSLESAGDAKSAMDFFVNSAVLSALLAALLLAAGLAAMGPSMSAAALIRCLVEAGAAGLLSYVFYLSSISRAAAWGGEIRSLFDLYRGELLKKLGYTQTATTRETERKVWSALTKQFLYGDPPPQVGKPLTYTDPVEPRIVATTQPEDIGLTITFGVQRASHGERRVIHRIENSDSAHRASTALQITSNPPEGTMYVWDSARLAGAPYSPPGTQPLVFELGALAFGASIEVEYRVLPAELRQKNS